MKYYKIFYLIFIATALSSCQKVVQIDLNTTDPKLVVEANITDESGPYTVKLSKSANYYDDNKFPKVNDAIVTIKDMNGNSDVLHPVADGMFQTSSIQGVPGRTYILNIYWNGKNYTGSSTMPYKVPIDSVLILLQGRGGFGGQGGPGGPGSTVTKRRRVVCSFKDPGEYENYYRIELFANDSTALDSTRIQILGDKLTNGQEMTLSFSTRLQVSDTIIVKLLGIDFPVYDFYNTLRNVVGDNGPFTSAPPANPNTNMSGGALGYFSAHWVSSKTEIVQ